MDSLKLILSDRKFFAPAWVFASLNIMTGTWVLYLPYIKTKFSLDDAQLGVALFCLAFGLLISIPFIPFINKKFGVGRSTQYGVLIFALAYNLPLIASSYLLVCTALFIVGIFSGFTDVSMNALVSIIEEKEDEHFMSAAHGFFSLGGFIGAGLGSILMLMIGAPIWHMMLVSFIIFISNVLLSKNYSQIRDTNNPQEEKNKWSWNRVRPLLGLAIVSFIIMTNEGAVEHWSNIFLFDVLAVQESQAGLGFVAFSLCMMTGRFFGDGLSKRFGSFSIMIACCLIALIGYAFVLSTQFYMCILGFGIVGLGLSVVIPEILRLAGKAKGVPASVGISIVSGIGFTGFLLGPVVLGFISNISSLIWSFVFLAVLLAFALILILFGLRGKDGVGR